MLYLMTGAPGSGKTLSAVEFIIRAKQERPERIIYAANIEGLNIPGVIILDDDGVFAWHEACEKNSLIVVDEAQRYWRAQRSGEPSRAIIEMETHRHDGIDIVMMTQHPTFLHANIRKLVNHHIHLVAYSNNSALRWEWRECHDDIQDQALRSSGDFTEWHYPAELFGYYTSATQHTKAIKRPLKRLIARIVLLGLGVVFLAFLGYVGWLVFHNDSIAELNGTASVDVPPVDSVPSVTRRDADAAPLTVRQWIEAQLPRVPTQPYSAPLYDGQAVTRHPRIFCIAVEPPDPCVCMTEQGTRYALDDTACRAFVDAGGIYDPFLPEDRHQHAQLPPPPVVPAVSPVAVDPGLAMSGVPAPRPAGVGSQVYMPPGYGPWNSDPFGGK